MSEYDAEAFDAFEAAGWEIAAGGYDFFAETTAQAIDPLLDAAEVHAGRRVLDLGTGPGEAVARAAERGADAVGIDVAAGMVALARERHPGLRFQHGSAVTIGTTEVEFTVRTVDELLAAFAEGTVRVRGLLPGASDEQRNRIRGEIETRLEPYRGGAGYSFPAPINIASGRKPS